MSNNLYEILGVSNSATPDEIRKAYKKRALETHPDRIPINASDSEKEAAGDAFRAVNNAYEVLSDVQNRRIYDQQGVWPPPEPEAGPSRQRRQNTFPNTPAPFFDPFMAQQQFMNDIFSNHATFSHPFPPHSHSRPNMNRPPPFMFTDPFELFNTMFGDIHQYFNEDAFFVNPSGFFRSDPVHGSNFPFGRSIFPGSSTMAGDAFGDPWAPMPSMISQPQNSDHMQSNPWSGVFSSSGSRQSGEPRWVEQSMMTRIVNGVKQSVSVKKDSEGNEHVTYQYPDGTTRTTVNGIDQAPPQATLPPPDSSLSGPVIPPIPRMATPSNGHSSHHHRQQHRSTTPLPPGPYGSSMNSGHGYPREPTPQPRSSQHHSHHRHHHREDRREDNPKRYRPYSVDSATAGPGPGVGPPQGAYNVETIRRERDVDERAWDRQQRERERTHDRTRSFSVPGYGHGDVDAGVAPEMDDLSGPQGQQKKKWWRPW